MLNFFCKNKTYAAIMIGIFLSFAAITVHAEVPNGAALIMYQHIDDEDNFPDESITIEQFTNHINEIKKAKYNVLPLSQIIEILKADGELPPKTIAIAFEASYKDVLEKAAPILVNEKIPFTIFFSSDIVKKQGTAELMTELLSTHLMEIGLATSDNQSLIGKSPFDIARKVNKSLTAYQDLFKQEPTIFIYPEGEYSNDVKDSLKSYKFAAAITSNIGAIGSKTDFSTVPSFLIDDNYTDIDRFIKTTYAKPLYISDLIPNDSIIKKNKPNIGFTLDDEIKNPQDISCVASDTGKLITNVVGGNRIEIRLKQPLIYNKTSINCTLPVRKIISNQNENPWQCFSFLLIKQTSAD